METTAMKRPYSGVRLAYDKMYKRLPDRKVIKASAAIPMLMEGGRSVPDDRCTVRTLLERMSRIGGYEDLIVCDASNEGIRLCDADGNEKFVSFLADEGKCGAPGCADLGGSECRDDGECDDACQDEVSALDCLYGHNLDDLLWRM